MKKRITKSIASIVLCMLMLTTAIFPAFAEGTDTSPSNSTEWLEIEDVDPWLSSDENGNTVESNQKTTDDTNVATGTSLLVNEQKEGVAPSEDVPNGGEEIEPTQTLPDNNAGSDEEDEFVFASKSSAWSVENGVATQQQAVVMRKTMLLRTAPTYTMTKTSTGYGFTGNGTGTIWIHYINGDIAWCIEAAKPSNSGEQYQEDAYATAAIGGVIEAAYDYGYMPSPSNKEAAAIQAAIWCVVEGNSIQVTSGADVDGVVQMANALINSGSYGNGTVTVYNCVTNSGHQKMATYVRATTPTPPPTPVYGSVRLEKSSANPDITNGSDCYSLEGAVYGIYESSANAKADRGRVGTLTTGADGKSNTVTTLDPGLPYFIREVTAPKGYELSDTVYTIYATANTVYKLEVADTPLSDPVSVLLRKVDERTGQPIPEGDMSLAGAEYTFKYYDIEVDSVDQIPTTATPTRTWVIRTNENGWCELSADFLVSGDAFYYNLAGRETLPIGVLTVQETKAPEGYKINDQLYFIKITADGADGSISTYNAPITPEHPLVGNIHIVKTTNTGLDKHEVFENHAEFEVYLKSSGSYADSAETDRAFLTTDNNGEATATSLPFGTYVVHQVTGWPGSAFADDFEVTIDTDGKTYDFEIHNERLYANVEIIKLDARTNLAIPQSGIGFKVFYPDGSLFVAPDGTDIWYTDDTGSLMIPVDLEYGIEYTAKEQNAPAGYIMGTEPIAFDITSETAIANGTRKVVTVHIPNEPTKIQVEKVDPYGDAVDGAELAILNSSGETVDSWATNGSAHTTYQLLVGEEYTLRETKAPSGYIAADDVKFTVGDTADVQQVSMVNVKQPKISTTASANGQKDMPADATARIIDTVEYADLVPGWQYTLVGTLMRKSTGEPLLDTNGEAVTSERKFTPSERGGSIDLTFPVDTSGLDGETVVVFEELYYNGRKIAEHKDIEDVDQSIYVPKIGTTATVNGQKIALAGKEVVLNDHVHYDNLVPGKMYTVRGVLMVKSTQKPLLNAGGEEITALAEFVAAESSGDVGLEFTFDASSLAGDAVVAYETLIRNDVIMCRHEDIDDENQTVRFPQIGTTLTGKSGAKRVSAGTEIVLTDTVSYKGLTPGKEYVVTGTLMDKTTEKPVAGKDGAAVTSTVTFTPEKADGTVEVIFTFNGSALSGRKLVAFEELAMGGNIYCEHKDIEDEGQTVSLYTRYTPSTPVISPSTGDEGIGRYVVFVIVSLIAIAGIGYAAVNHKKED